jgi:beta-galactosidase
MIVVPALYAASDDEIAKLKAYVHEGGHLILSFKSGFSDENLKVRSAVQPGGFADAVGATYSQFAIPENTGLTSDLFPAVKGDQVRWWMELLQPTTATVIAHYEHPVWGSYAAITRNRYGKGEVTYIGFMPGDALMEKILGDAADRALVSRLGRELRFPLIVRSGVNGRGKTLHYLLNYSALPQELTYSFVSGTDLLSGKRIQQGRTIDLAPWGVEIVEEAAR